MASNASGAPRGGGSGRARGRGRGGGQASRGGAQAPPLAAQLRQLDRLQEPEEMAVLRRYRDLGAAQIRSVYGLSGLLSREIQVPGSVLQRINPNREYGSVEWLSLLEADNALQHFKVLAERERALARREQRLPTARHRTAWGDLTPEERRILLLSQKEWNSFRARSTAGARPAQTAPVQAAPRRPATPPAQIGSRAGSPARQPESAAALRAAADGSHAGSVGGTVSPQRSGTPTQGSRTSSPSKK